MFCIMEGFSLPRTILGMHCIFIRTLQYFMPDSLVSFVMFVFARKGKGKWMLHKNDSSTHFMHSESTLVYYNTLLKDAYDAQRAKYSLHGRRGLLVADAFTGNFAKRQGELVCITMHLEDIVLAVRENTIH